MTPDLGRVGVRIALLLIIPSLLLLLLQPRDSPGFVISGLTLAMGLVFLAVVVALVLHARQKTRI